MQPLLYMYSPCCTYAAPAVHMQPQPSTASHSQPCPATARQQHNLPRIVCFSYFSWSPCCTYGAPAVHMQPLLYISSPCCTCFQSFQFQAKPNHAASSKPPETWPLARFLGAKNLNLFFPAGWEPCLIGWGLACSPNASLVILFSSFILKSNQKKRKSLEHQRWFASKSPLVLQTFSFLLIWFKNEWRE